MNFLESVKMAFASLMINKMRSFLTMLGIIIGISAVITITTIGNSIQKTLSNTFNTLAGMTLGIPVPGINFLLFAVIILIGHALNLALSCLGAFVHPLRLNFLEFFKNSAYDGKGRNYRPVKK